jgi:hypothetical protein
MGERWRDGVVLDWEKAMGQGRRAKQCRLQSSEVGRAK